MPRSNYDYSQAVIGDCGHVCSEWPQFSTLGKPGRFVICDTCTREKYAIPDEETLAVWVRIKEKKATPVEDDLMRTVGKTKAPRKTTPRKKKLRCVLCGKDHVYSDCPLVMELPDGS